MKPVIVQEHGKATSLDMAKAENPNCFTQFFSLHLIGKSHTIALAQRTQLLNINTKINLKSIFTKTFCSMHAFLTLTRIKAIFFGLGNSFCKALADWHDMVLHEEKLLSLPSLSHPAVSATFHSITPRASSGSGNHWKRWHRCQRALRFQF